MLLCVFDAWVLEFLKVFDNTAQLFGLLRRPFLGWTNHDFASKVGFWVDLLFYLIPGAQF